MIFLVNRLGEVHAVQLEFLSSIDQGQLERLFRSCAWCPTWGVASDLSRKRRRALELLKL